MTTIRSEQWTAGFKGRRGLGLDFIVIRLRASVLRHTEFLVSGLNVPDTSSVGLGLLTSALDILLDSADLRGETGSEGGRDAPKGDAGGRGAREGDAGGDVGGDEASLSPLSSPSPWPWRCSDAQAAASGELGDAWLAPIGTYTPLAAGLTRPLAARGRLAHVRAA